MYRHLQFYMLYYSGTVVLSLVLIVQWMKSSTNINIHQVYKALTVIKIVICNTAIYASDKVDCSHLPGSRWHCLN